MQFSSGRARVRQKSGKPIFTLVLLAAMRSSPMTEAQNPSQQPAPSAASQQPTPAPASQNSADLLKALDQVVDQNRKLTEQNQQLMVKIEELRQQVEAANPTIATAEAEKAAAQLSAASAQATAGAKQTTVSVKEEQAAQTTIPSRTNVDDKTEFPESSDGNPAIFGE